MHVTFEMMLSTLDNLVTLDRVVALLQDTQAANPRLTLGECTFLVDNLLRREKESLLVLLGWTVDRYDTEFIARHAARGL